MRWAAFVRLLGSSRNLAQQAVHFSIGYSVTLTGAYFHHRYALAIAVCVFAVAKETYDVMGPEKDTVKSSLFDVAMYCAGAGMALLVTRVV